ncbi:MAG: hypothetical protein EOO28_28830 [Comamonadaceae bacterium]|nr:MAG: hypothetical protein EOO28_28830 [Comamonadaceae bacterium]
MKFYNRLLLNLVFISTTTHAAVISETLCYRALPKNKNKSAIKLTIKKYYDEELGQQVGAIVRYNTSKETIPLSVIEDAIDDENNDYEIHWLEVINKKVTGEYVFMKPKGATVLGAYIIYKNQRLGKELAFSPSGETGNECVM